MKKYFLLIVACLSLAAFWMTGCTYIIGSGNTVTKDYDFRDFNKIEVSSAFRFDITRSDSYSVSISTRENIVEHLDIYLSGQTLKIRLKPGSYSNADTQATVTLPELEGLVISGASQGEVKGFKSSKDLDIRISGASRVTMEVEAGKTTMDISGASKVTGSLTAQNTNITISGASRCDLSGSAVDGEFNISGASQAITKDFKLKNADMELSGASKATINTDGKLNVNVSGASTLEYTGAPTLGKVDVTGASKLKKLE